VGLAYLCSSVFICGSLSAQEVDPNSLFGRDTTQSVFVRDSAVAVEKFALARRMEQLKEWDKAADVYQELVKNFADRVVPSQVDKDNKIYQYTSVIPAVQELLARWPQDGLEVYRGRFEGEAAAVLETAHDNLSQLHRVYSIYFITDSGKKAGMRMIDLYFERGEFAAAAWIGDRLLSWHPALKDDQPRILYRVAMAYRLAGNDELAQARLKQLQEKFPQASASIRGGEVILADSLAHELTASALHSNSPDSWPIAFGSPDRARVPQVNSFGGARLFGIELPKGMLRTTPQYQRQQFDAANTRDIVSGLMTGIFPVVDHGELFFQDNARIYGVSLESGQPLPGWAETYDGERSGRFTLPNAIPFPRSQQTTVTVTDDAVYAVMGMSDLIAMQYMGGYGLRDTKLVCLDRASGRQKWIADRKSLPADLTNLQNLDFSGSPLVVGDTVYIQMRGGKGAQFEDSYVLAMEAETGKFKWACYVASANSTANYWDGSDLGAVFGQNLSHLAYASGRLYALTNLGAIASIDAYDGTVVWLNLYNRDPVPTNTMLRLGRGWNRAQRTISNNPTVKPWSSNPVMVTQGKVFILPSDGSNVLIYDAASGKEIKRISMNDYAGADAILGIVDEKLVISNDRQVFCINWQKYEENKEPAVRDTYLVWRSPSFQRTGSVDDSLRGRGIVTADSVIVPTAWQLYRLSLSGGRILESYPPGNGTTWSEEEGPGNVIMTSDRLIIAGPTKSGQMRVTAYTDLTLAMKKLDAEIAASPNDPAPRLRSAEILFVAGKVDPAIAKLDEAMGLLAGGGAGSSARDRVFNTALNFAQKLARDSRADPALATVLYERAGVAAATPAQKVNYRISRAAYAKQTSQPELELRLCQQILSDPQLRAVPVANADDDAVTPAGEVARLEIDDLLSRTNRTLYAPLEKAAVDMLAAAGAAKDPQQIQEVAMVYPNSLIAPQALLAAADVYESRGDSRTATQVLRQALFRYPKTPESQRAFESMARNYLKMPNRVSAAIARLKQGAAVDGRTVLTRPLILPDGEIVQNVSFNDAIRALQKFSSQLAIADLPDVKFVNGNPDNVSPFKAETPQSIISGITALTPPESGFGRRDRVVTFTTGVGIRVYPVGGLQPTLTSDALSQPPRGAAWIGDELLVWNASEMALIGSNGLASWKTTLKSLPQLEVVAQASLPGDDEAVPANPLAQLQQQQQQIQIIGGGRGGEIVVINGQIIRGNNIVIGPGGVVRLNGGAVGVAPQPAELARPAVEEIDKVRILTDRAILSTTDGRVIALDLSNAKVLWQTRVADRRPSHLLATDDFVVTRITDDNGATAQIAVFDSFSGQIIGRNNFGSESGLPIIPVNLALSPDGILVYLVPNAIVFADLFETNGLKQAKSQPPRAADNIAGAFMNSTSPDTLQIIGERVLATGISPSGAMVWMYDLHTGAPIRFNSNDYLVNVRDPSLLGEGRFMIRAAGSIVYVVTPTKVRGFNLDRGQEVPADMGAQTARTLRDVVVAKSHVLVMSELSGARPRALGDPAAPVHVATVSRAEVNGRESGLFDYETDIKDRGVLGLQVVDGGIYYLGSDNRLHFLQGNGVKP
jgi:outer membrane protein assembly factor BamB/tetratricopeptide (TPR) repeat protein